MNRLYFLKGFGVGVIFCVCVLGIACAYRTSEGEIIRQARELGMVFAKEADEESKLVFASTKPAITATPETEDEKEKDKDKGEKAAVETAQTPEVTASPSPEPSPSPQVLPSPDAKPKQTPKPRKPKNSAGGEKVTLQITRGMWSDAVSAALAQKGLIDDAEAFDKYLNNNGYASFIRVGTFKIPKGATYEQIATIITSE